LQSAMPPRLFLEFDRRAYKDVPVRANLKGSPAPGYRVLHSAADPPIVRVSGPEARLHNLDAALTDVIHLDGLEHSVTVVSNASVSDPQLRIESPAPVSVDITIERGKPSP